MSGVGLVALNVVTTRSNNMEYHVITKGNPLEVWAMGFYDRERAESKVREGYWHQYMYEKDKHKELEVVETIARKRNHK
jgi:hypothetical protein